MAEQISLFLFLLPFLLIQTISCVSTGPASKLQQLIKPADIEAILQADVVLLGEQHDNPHHHAIQAELIKLSGQKSRLGSVVFEQVTWEQQAVLAALTSRTLGDLPQKLSWESSGWPAFGLYEPLFAAATDYRAQLIAGNIVPEKSKAIYREGYAAVFQEAEIAKLGLGEELEPKAKEALEQEIFEGHCKLLPRDHVKAMIPIQRARDAAMALAWYRLHRGGQSIFIVGAGHARKDFGIPWYLKRLKPELKIYSLGMSEQGSPADPSAFDLLLTTEGVTRKDPCEELKAKFSTPRSY